MFFKFLDGSRIQQLCSYLELIHKKGKAVDQHTNLLIGAYVKLNAREKIAEFVKDSTNLNTFDLESAIKVKLNLLTFYEHFFLDFALF